MQASRRRGMPLRNESEFDHESLPKLAAVVRTDRRRPRARHQRASIEDVAERYAVAITPSLAELIDTADANDPIARQFIPDPAELVGASRSELCGSDR